MTETDRTALRTLASQMRECIAPGDTLDALWEWVFDLEACAQGARTVLGYTPEQFRARGHALLAKRMAQRGRC